MAIKVNPIVLSGDLGKKWWHFPDVLWRKSKNLRERRLRLTLSRQILPLLQKIEAVQLEESPTAVLYLKGKSLSEVEKDPIALEIALYICEMATSDGLIRFVPNKGASPTSIRSYLDTAVGSCGITPNEIARRYVCKLAKPILKAGGHDPDDLGIFLSSFLQTRIRSLGRLRILSQLGKDTVNEMRLGLPNLDALLEQDEEWLLMLCNIDASEVIRPLRNALQVDFIDILSWPIKLFMSFAKNINSSEKINALGKNILKIKDPAMFEALGSWPTEKDENGNVVCRITQIRKTLGDDLFLKVTTGSPALVKDLGTWPQKKIDLYKPYLGVLTGPAMKLLEGLDENQRLAVISGLIDKLETPIVTQALRKKDGLIMLQGVVNEIRTMNRNSKQTPDKIKKLVTGTYFDDYMGNLSVFN